MTKEELLEENRKLRLELARLLREITMLKKRIKNAYQYASDVDENNHQVIKELMDEG